MTFGGPQDFAQVVKIFGQPVDGEARYSPAEITDIHVTAISGDADLDRACTSHIELVESDDSHGLAALHPVDQWLEHALGYPRRGHRSPVEV